MPAAKKWVVIAEENCLYKYSDSSDGKPVFDEWTNCSLKAVNKMYPLQSYLASRFLSPRFTKKERLEAYYDYPVFCQCSIFAVCKGFASF